MHAIFTAIAAALAVVGNVASSIARLLRSGAGDTACRALMLQLCVSDGMRGMYLATVSVAGWLFQGHYLWQDIAWRRNKACHLSAFLSVLSIQVSAGIISLVTMDNVATRCFLMARLRFQPRSACLPCAASWLIGVVVALVTTFLMTSRRRGSVIMLCDVDPVISGVIICNFVLHVLICAGEVSVFLPSLFRSNSHNPAVTTNTSVDVAYIGTFKAMCWLIVSLPVIVHTSNATLPVEVPVNITVFVLPLNPTLKPLLSALAVVVTRRRQTQKARLMKILAVRAAARSS